MISKPPGNEYIHSVNQRLDLHINNQGEDLFLPTARGSPQDSTHSLFYPVTGILQWGDTTFFN